MGKIEYPIGDFLIRIKNALMAGNKSVSSPYTKLVLSVAKKFENLGYLNQVKKEDNVVIAQIAYKSKQPILMDISLVSKPGLRVYKTFKEIESYKNPAIMIISTSKGIMSSREAVKNKTGGEVIAKVL